MFQITRKTLPALALATTIAGFSGAGWAADPWAVEAGDSEIEFTGTQLGAAFEGEFKSFTAEIVFSPDDLAGSSVKVLIDIASVDTANGDRDSQIVSPDWFDAAQWPTAKFETKSFSETAPGQYEAVADLTIRDVTREVILPFDLEIEGNEAKATGTVTINRTDFGVGQGQWADTSQVGDPVTIEIDIEAKRP
ncbi:MULTISPECIES: YceI family protein [unclassified Thalassospira]|uniref:YceI family protein n=1 Tax=unclassified Thalassospira TaxID=2648997 RepID=UPI0025F4BE00|nr:MULTISPECIES: YceI family protein [unclassified Thalassospira]|tara:strand:+ start:407 stop:985 length:579 start_codon:yes stop_codon:yes gene_type:complete